MARLAISLAGAAAGFAIGGPAGARWGWTIGSIAGGLMFPQEGPGGQDTQGPRLQDRGVTSSAYGQMRPIVYGVAPVPGNVIDASELYETAHVQKASSGGKGGGGGDSPSHTTYTYSRDLAVGLGESIAGVLQIFANERLVYDATPGSTVRQPSWLNLKIYTGTETQLPDPTLEAIHGAGNVPAYRGEAYVVFKRLELEEFGNRPPIFRFVVVSEGSEAVSVSSVDLGVPVSGKVLNQVNAITYDERSGLVWVTVSRDWTNDPEECVFAIEPYSQTIIYRKSSPAFNGSSWTYSFKDAEIGGYLDYTGLIGVVEPVIVVFAINSSSSGNYYYIYDAESGEEEARFFVDKSRSTIGPIRSCYTERLRIYQYSSLSGLFGSHIASGLSSLLQFGIEEPTDWDWGGNGHIAVKPSQSEGAIIAVALKHATDPDKYAVGVFEDPIITTLTSSYLTYSVAITIAELPTGSDTAKDLTYDSSQDCFWFYETGLASILDDGSGASRNRFHKISTAGVLIATYDFWQDYGIDGNTITGDARPYIYSDQLSPDLWFASGAVAYQWNVNTLDAPVTYSLTEGGTVNYAHTPSDALIHGEHGNSTLDAKVHLSTLHAITAGVVTLKSVAEDLCARPGLDAAEYDATTLAGIQVKGYRILNLTTARNALEPLRQAYLFDPAEDGEKIEFVLRGGSSVATLTDDDLGAHPYGSERPPPIRISREHETALPKTLNLSYLNLDANYEPGTQTTRRLACKSGTTLQVNLAVAMNDDDAVQLADILEHLAHIERLGYEVAVMPAHLGLKPAQIITADTGGRQYPMRITEKGFEQGVVPLRGLRDDASVYTSYLSGVSGITHDPAISMAGPTLLFLLDIPMLRDADNDAGFYAAATSWTPDWPGGVLYKSADDSDYAQIGGLPAVAAAGFALNAPSADGISPWRWDESTGLNVRLITGTLSSVTEAQCLAENNAAIWGQAGRWEIVLFQTATLNGDGSYTISKLVRGRRGTEDAMARHSIGDRFVFIDSATLMRLTAQVSEVGDTNFYKAVTISRHLDETYPYTLTHIGSALLPWAPVQPSTVWEGDDDIALSWVRRDRFSALPLWSPDMSESSESYEIDILDDAGAVVRALTATTPTVTYSSADQVTDFGENQKNIKFNIYQMSAAVGRGYVLNRAIYLGRTDYIEAVMDLSPEIYWQLDETSGTVAAADKSGNGHTGTIESDADLDDVGALPGVPTTCLRSIEDAGKGASVMSVSALNVSTYAWAGFIYLEAIPTHAYGVFISGTTGGVADRELWVKNDGKVQFECNNGGSIDITSSVALSAGQWYHIVASVGPTYGQKIHINGVTRATDANTAAHTGSNKNYYVGGAARGWGFYSDDRATILIDEPAALTSEISEAQAATLYAAR